MFNRGVLHVDLPCLAYLGLRTSLTRSMEVALSHIVFRCGRAPFLFCTPVIAFPFSESLTVLCSLATAMS